jgi:hypothetical protein
MNSAYHKEDVMKRTVFVISACFLLFLLAGLSLPQEHFPIQKSTTNKLPPKITSVSQNYTFMAIDLVLNGRNFPSKNSGTLWRLIRLRGPGSAAEGVKSKDYFCGQNGDWTPTRVHDLIPHVIPLGQKYKIGIIQYDESNVNTKTLLSNEVEFLIHMSLDNVTPNPVPSTTTEVKVSTANVLGPQGSKVAVLSHHQAQITQWGGPPPLNAQEFKIRIPSDLPRPGTYDLWVQDGGNIVSKRIQVKLLGLPVPAVK